MAEFSRFWTTNNTGDGPSGGYSSANFAQFVREVFLTNWASEGVLRGVLNNLAVSGSSSPVAVNTGAALVYGFYYGNDASVNVTIPTPASATRVDRIVLRVSWAAQTVRITRIAGTEGAGAPALTQIANTTWDIPLASVSITTGGAITVTDQRDYVKHPGAYGWLDEAVTITGNLTVSGTISGTLAAGLVGTTQIVDGAVTAAKIAADTITASQIAANAITASELADNAVDTAAIAASAVTTAKIADGAITAAKIAADAITASQIAANAIGSSELADGAVDTAAIADGAVTAAKIANGVISQGKMAANSIGASEIIDGSVGTSELGNDAVDDTKAGARVPQFYRRQGGDANNWRTPGTSAQTPGAVRMQAGAVTLTFSSNSGASASVTFPTAFSNVPIGFVAVGDKGAISGTGLHVQCDTTAAGMTINLLTDGLVSVSGNVTVNWLAIGPE